MDNPLEARSPRSPPPKLDDEAPRPLPSLPTEILQRIIQLALPRLSYKTFRERYDVLLACCRVNKLWAALAQEELYRHVGLRDGAAAKLFLATIRAGSSGGFRVHSFRLLVTEVAGHPLRSWLQKPVRLSQVKELLKISPKLRGLRIVGETEDPVFNLSVLSALIAEGLEDLTFTLCDFMPSPSASPLFSSRLRRLTLFLLTDPADLAPILAWADLPQLEALIIVNGFLPLTSEDTNALEKALLRYSARLKSFPLSFGPSDERRHLELSSALWSSFSALDTLTLDCNSPVHTILPLLSSAPLTRLRLCPPYDDLERRDLSNLVHALLSSPKSLQLVKQIMVPTPNELATAEDEATRSSLVELCARQGIELTEREEFPTTDWIASLEEALDAW